MSAQPTAPPSAKLLVEIYPIGMPGRVGVAVHNVGREKLTKDEAVRVLREALDGLENAPAWEG